MTALSHARAIAGLATAGATSAGISVLRRLSSMPR
jgi:hypothetical protein